MYGSWRERYGADSVSTLLKAGRLAHQTHRGQMRSSGAPYIKHPIAALRMCIEQGMWHPELLQTLLLHDAVEEAKEPKRTYDAIREICSQDVAYSVITLTNIHLDTGIKMSMQEYFDHFEGRIVDGNDWMSLFAKPIESRHNLHTLDSFKPAKQYMFIAEKLACYLPILRRLYQIVPSQFRSRYFSVILSFERDIEAAISRLPQGGIILDSRQREKLELLKSVGAKQMRGAPGLGGLCDYARLQVLCSLVG